MQHLSFPKGCRFQAAALFFAQLRRLFFSVIVLAACSPSNLGLQFLNIYELASLTRFSGIQPIAELLRHLLRKRNPVTVLQHLPETLRLTFVVHDSALNE